MNRAPQEGHRPTHAPGPAPAATPAEAARRLAAEHAEIAGAVEQFGLPRFGRRPRVDERFTRLARSIAGQQLTVRAAHTIFERVRAEVGDITSTAVLATDPAALRRCGLSGAKVAALLDLADQTERGSLRLDRLGHMSETEVIDALTAVRGIGPWTAQMFLLGSLHHLDVWPTGDAGVRNGFAVLFGLDRAPTAEELEPRGEPFAPHRSIVAWYCWQAADADPDTAGSGEAS